jgi:hypothetical protein
MAGVSFPEGKETFYQRACLRHAGLRGSCVSAIPAAKKPVTIIPDPLCHVRGLLAIAKLCWKSHTSRGSMIANCVMND